ncbi:hypothetical protein AMTRI_Chr12g235470 [Amborella trichopoda]
MNCRNPNNYKNQKAKNILYEETHFIKYIFNVSNILYEEILSNTFSNMSSTMFGERRKTIILHPAESPSMLICKYLQRKKEKLHEKQIRNYIFSIQGGYNYHWLFDVKSDNLKYVI